MAIKDGTHLPTIKFRENYDSVFRKKVSDNNLNKLSPETTKQFLEGMNKKK